MLKKILGAGALTIGGVVAYSQSYAAPVSFTVPTSTAGDFTAQAVAIIGDPGLLSIIVLAAGLPLAFWAIHKLIGLIPKKTGSR